MKNKPEDKMQEQGYGLGKSLAIVFGITALVVGAIVALKFLIG